MTWTFLFSPTIFYLFWPCTWSKSNHRIFSRFACLRFVHKPFLMLALPPPLFAVLTFSSAIFHYRYERYTAPILDSRYYAHIHTNLPFSIEMDQIIAQRGPTKNPPDHLASLFSLGSHRHFT